MCVLSDELLRAEEAVRILHPEHLRAHLETVVISAINHASLLTVLKY